MNKKIERKITEIENWFDTWSDDLDNDYYSVLFVANNTHTNATHYSITGEPVGLVNNLVDAVHILTDYIGYDTPEQLSEVVLKLLKLKRNMISNGLSLELCQPQLDSICDSIYAQWLKHQQELDDDTDIETDMSETDAK